MMQGGVFQCSDGLSSEGTSEGPGQPPNPLICSLCKDYFFDPCLLSCYHTFCTRCLRGKSVDNKISCPLCCHQTLLKDGVTVPPSDLLMRQLIEIANAENPPCANCDKRDRASMFFCSTCGQALCTHCRENTHRAKMFSTHEVVHMSKCSKEVHRRCAVHGEQYIMFSNSQRNMLCVNCFRDTPAEARLHCVDIDTAYTQGCKKLDRAIMNVQEAQTSVRDGVLSYRNLLDELRRNTDSEKMTIHSFCQGMQEAINKTQASMILEVQRQFESKERLFRNQLASLSTVLPILQMHLMLCQSFSSTANKFQFLDLAYPMMDRLSSVSQLSQPMRPLPSSQIRTNYRSEFAHSLEPWIGKLSASIPETNIPPGMFDSSQVMPPPATGQPPAQTCQTITSTTTLHPAPPSRKQHSALKAKALEGEGPFSNHCRSFDSQIKELGVQLTNVRERLCELQRDIALLRRAATPPLAKRHLGIKNFFCWQSNEIFKTNMEFGNKTLNDKKDRNELGVQLTNVRERLCELQRDIALLRRAATPPLAKRHLGIARDCERLDDTLQRYHVELDRLRSVFDTLWQEQLYRIHVEQDIFQSQINDIVSLRSEVKQLALAAQQLEPYVKSLSSQNNLEDMANLQSLIDRITALQEQHYRMEQSSQKQGGEIRSQVVSPTAENTAYLKDLAGKSEMPVREGTRTRTSREQYTGTGDTGMGVYGGRTTPGGESRTRGVISQLIDKVRTKEERKKSPVGDEMRGPLMRERSKSEGRGKEALQTDGSGRSKFISAGKPDSSNSYRVMSGSSSAGGPGSKRPSLYHTISGKVLGARDSVCNDVASLALDIPPPPPARRPDDSQQQQQQQMTAQQCDASAAAISKQIREHLENHLKQKLKLRNRIASRSKDSLHYPGGDEDECNYQRISEATSTLGGESGAGGTGGGGGVGGTSGGGEGIRVSGGAVDRDGSGSMMIRALVHPTPPSPPHRPTRSHQVYPHSDTEDSVFYSETPNGRRRSSVDLMDRRKTLVVLINSGKSKSRLMQKQRSWETFPPKKRQESSSKFCRDPESFRGAFDLAGLKKADSFEGHEEAVRTLVAAVQETRTLRKPKSPAPSTPTSGRTPAD